MFGSGLGNDFWMPKARFDTKACTEIFLKAFVEVMQIMSAKGKEAAQLLGDLLITH